MGLSNYVAEVRAASEGAKVELKDRRMLSASHRFKKHDSAELQRLMEEQERIFELVSHDIPSRHSFVAIINLVIVLSHDYVNSLFSRLTSPCG